MQERERERERERTYDICVYSLNIFITLSLKSFVESFIFESVEMP